MTNPLTHDPFYKRVKDALLIVFAVYTIWPGIKEKIFPSSTSDRPETPVVVLQSQMQGIESRMSRLEDKIDRIYLWQRRSREDR